MRVAVSDYDGTLKRGGEVAAGDLAAIIKWMESGNKFGLATGRDLGMTLHETERHGIPFDFLVCMNGCSLYGRDRSLIQQTKMDDALIPELLNHPAADAAFHIAVMGQWQLSLFFRGGESWFLRVGIPYREISFDEAVSRKNVEQVSFGYVGRGETAEWARQLNRDFAGRLVAHQNVNSIDVNPAGTDKAQGVKDLLALKKWAPQDVLAIGDGGNDLGMLGAFGGYTLENAPDEVKKTAKCVVGSVAEMLACF